MSKERNPYDIYSLAALRARRAKKKNYDLYPSFNRRMTAATLDSLALMTLTPLYNYLAPIQRSNTNEVVVSGPGSMASHLFADPMFVETYLQNMLLQIGVFLMYSGIFWHIWGATPGKIATQTKVVDNKTGAKPSLLQIILRLLGYLISTFCLFAGILWIGLNKRRRAWHDYLSDTVVVTQAWPLPYGRVKAVAYSPKDEKNETAAD
jgi:uncharacterized RDD family membrane protein YckC